MKAFIGWDSREPIAYDVCEHSIRAHNTQIEIQALKQEQLKQDGFYWRDVDTLGSTEFTFTRFLVPQLMNFNGWAIFADCDFLWLSDIQEIFDQADDSKAVLCVQHDYTPKVSTKMDGKIQYGYPRKNWSSMVLWNCAHPSNRQITAAFVNAAEPLFLHRFLWLKDEEIGQISHHYNWLVDWYEEPIDGSPKVLHYTTGGPYFRSYANCAYHRQWLDQFEQLKGRRFSDQDFVDRQ